MWLLIGLSLYLLVALATFSPEDPGWSLAETGVVSVSNAGGRLGAWLADLGLFLFGFSAYLVPLMLAWSAYVAFRRSGDDAETRVLMLVLHWLGLLLVVVAGSALASLMLPTWGSELPNGVGGGLGASLSGLINAFFGQAGGALLLFALLLIGLTLATGQSPLMLVDGVGLLALDVVRLTRGLVDSAGVQTRTAAWRDRIVLGLLTRLRRDDAPAVQPHERTEPRFGPEVTMDGLGDSDSRLAPIQQVDEGGRTTHFEEALPASIDPAQSTSGSERPTSSRAARKGRRLFGGSLSRPQADARPPLNLLDVAKKSGAAVSPEQLDAMSRELEARLAEFGVVAEVVAVHPGPVVALFELELAPGLKVSKITGLAKDIARALSKVSVRVVEVIPGKSVIGLEVPNDHREMVYLSEILGSDAYLDSKSPLTIGMGTNISGGPVVADLARMPHALIAGTTGSGKSVAINAVILSLLYKASPEEVRLIMVDPKMLELSVYEGIPHLLTPVVTDMKEAANALRWCVGEMERRYKLMANLGVRNIAGFNREVEAAIDAGTPIPDPLYRPEEAINPQFDEEGQPIVPTLTKLPYIVVIIDELADMMMVVGKKVEELIARLAQKARASGIHLLLATQRPSVDVLTGLIKANIPTRVAFKVSARVDSRTVLDQMGAEHLLGHGDMLYLPPGGSIPQRVHGAFVDDHEVHRVVDFLKQTGEPDYIDCVLQEPSDHLPGIDPEPRGGGDVEDQDPLFDEAVQFVTESRRASISGVQRKLKIGYNRAARMIEEMERIGIVGAAETNGNREVLAPPPARD